MNGEEYQFYLNTIALPMPHHHNYLILLLEATRIRGTILNLYLTLPVGSYNATKNELQTHSQLPNCKLRRMSNISCVCFNGRTSIWNIMETARAKINALSNNCKFTGIIAFLLCFITRCADQKKKGYCV